MDPKPMRHHGTEHLACIGVTCACLLLVGLFIWLIAESTFALR